MTKLDGASCLSWMKQIESLLVIEGISLLKALKAEEDSAPVKAERLTGLESVLSSLEQELSLQVMKRSDIKFSVVWENLEASYTHDNEAMKSCIVTQMDNLKLEK